MVKTIQVSVALNIVLSVLLIGQGMGPAEPPQLIQNCPRINPTTLTTLQNEMETTAQKPSVSMLPSVAEITQNGQSVKLRRKHLMYDPARDQAYINAVFVESNHTYPPLTPNPSMLIQVRPKRIITLDEAVHAYDLWFEETAAFNRLSWMGVSMQQDPSDAIAIQQMLYHVKPDLVIEIGTNTGGGAIFYSSIMRTYNPSAKVLTLDIKDISNWKDGAKTGSGLKDCDRCIMGNEHPYWNDGGIHFKIGRLTNDPDCPFLAEVQQFVKEMNPQTVIVIEDASHRYADVKVNMEALHSFVTPNSYLLVQDTKIDRLFRGKVAGPVRAIDEFLAKHSNFVVDRRYEWLMYSQHHRGWLRRTE